MKTQKLFKLWSLFYLSGCLLLGSVSAHELLIPSQIKEPLEKIYLSCDRIFIHPEGIFYVDEMGEVLPTRFVGSDECGLYILAPRERCPNCGQSKKGGVCQNPYCECYGK